MGKTIFNHNSIKREFNRRYNNIQFIHMLLFVSSIPHAIWILFSIYSQPIKILSSGSLWIALILILKNSFLYKRKHYRLIDRLILCLLIITGLQFIRFIIFDNMENTLTVLTNPINGLCLCIPLLYYIYNYSFTLKYVYRCGLILICISSICFQGNYYVLYLSPIIIQYSLHTKKKRIFIYCILLLSLLFIIKDAFIPNELTGDTQRAFIIILIYAIIVIIAKLYKKYYRLIALCVACISITLPISLFSYSIATKESIFTRINDMENEKIGVDTRTFLYTELLTDLNQKKAFWEGLGIAQGYNSFYFFKNKTRDVNEVHFLHLLFRGGSLWLFFYMAIIIYSIFYAIKFSKNYLCLGGSIMLSGYFLAGFICDINGFNFIHVIIFFFIAACSSNKWTQLSNSNVLRLIK
ncbi:conserved domain protein [Bacteroides fluxus YIT 12057]|uniref:Conserved domain protein n=2 Tax=Bacteroides fluxus TaxID=626930 RepID=F3PVQ0_9BACE|nr:conserved domain protein [Bacteroides fluxus YIT 12057]